MADRIEIVRFVGGKPRAEVKDECPLWSTGGCTVKPIPCRYGLTEVKVPKDCPLRIGDVTTIVTLSQGWLPDKKP